MVGGNGGSNGSSLDLLIKDNGKNSDNSIKVNDNNGVTVFQDNTAIVTNNVDSDASTGKNDANGNTGGDVTVTTGNATSDVNVNNDVNFNAASVGCDCT